MEQIRAIIASYVTQLPMLLVWLAAIIFSIINWNRHPAVSKNVIFGAAGLIVMSIISNLISIWLPMFLMEEKGLNYSQMGITLNIVWFLHSLINAGLWILILAAIFGDRKNPSNQ